MKNAKLKLAALGIIASGLFAFTTFFSGTIKGTVTPSDAAVRVWALSGSDTLKAVVANGAFEILDAKPGTYKVIVEAKAPYKNQMKDGVTVSDGQATDVGQIKLAQ